VAEILDGGRPRGSRTCSRTGVEDFKKRRRSPNTDPKGGLQGSMETHRDRHQGELVKTEEGKKTAGGLSIKEPKEEKRGVKVPDLGVLISGGSPPARGSGRASCTYRRKVRKEGMRRGRVGSGRKQKLSGRANLELRVKKQANLQGFGGKKRGQRPGQTIKRCFWIGQLIQKRLGTREKRKVRRIGRAALKRELWKNSEGGTQDHRPAAEV